MNVLGIETSCDETAAAVIQDNTVIAEALFSQIETHRQYKGVVPEIAARAHVEKVDIVIAAAMAQAGLDFAQLDGIAVTAGPGLIGGVVVGVMAAKAIAMVHNLPFIAVNHLEGHALSPRLGHDIAFPYLLVLVSGGHCQILEAQGIGRYRLLGQTLDDAIGETFDKVAAMLGLPYPGGPAIEALAKQGDGTKYNLPRPLIRTDNCDFSLSGLKTAVRNVIQGLGELTDTVRADIGASFQQAVIDCLLDRTARALERVEVDSVVVAGGVAANQAIAAACRQLVEKRGKRFFAPPLKLCTDNGTMIAYVGQERLKRGLVDGLDVRPRPRWELTTLGENYG
jgi:N6-L-threonylcarbamoyladenine synthase